MDFLNKRDFIRSPYRSEREKVICIKRWNIKKYVKLLDQLDDFFESDKCYHLADNYLVAMVFTYFLRASLEPEEYTKQYFFAALFLAYNMEEDEGESLLIELEEWLDCSVVEIRQLRFELFQRMEYRASVSRFCCEIVMRNVSADHKIWKRRRLVYHFGVAQIPRIFDLRIDRDEKVCPICGPINKEEEEDFIKSKTEIV